MRARAIIACFTLGRSRALDNLRNVRSGSRKSKPGDETPESHQHRSRNGRIFPG
jgi:hypothetical protein